MTISKPLISLQNVSRRYKLRSKSRVDLLNLLGFNFGGGAAQEFWALRDITLSVPKGQRLGIIGRNGAGKSTLLKIIAGITQPTEGKVWVGGRTETLMQLGAGFHPDFTGRDNVVGSLAYRGVIGSEAQRLADEIIEFAELEEFQDNPLKTYSSGMAARLGFAAATAIAPEVLIIDEILGAGDAYFASKSFDRMRRLTSGGTTVLFVSHDMGSVESLCDEAIWIERGRIRDSGSTHTLSRAYAREVREQEKLRLKARNAQVSVANFRAMRGRHGRPLQFITRLVSTGQALSAHRCALYCGGFLVGEVRIGDAQDVVDSEVAAIVLDREASRWGAPQFGGVPSRPLPAAEGAAGMAYFNLTAMEPDADWSVEWTVSGGAAAVEAFDGTAYRRIGEHQGGATAVQRYHVPRQVIASFLMSEGFDVPEPASQSDGLAGPVHRLERDEEVTPDHTTGDVEINGVIFENEEGEQTHLFRTFERMKVRLRYKALRAVSDALFVVCFYRDGICAMQSLSAIDPDQASRLEAGEQGEAVFEVGNLPLGKGLYLVSVGIFPKAVLSDRTGDHIAYVLLDRQIQVRIEQPEGGVIDLGIARAPADWTLRKDAVEPSVNS